MSYMERAKNAVLRWAASHSDELQKWGERTKYLGVGLGAGAYGLTNYLGITEPGAQSKIMVLAAAPVFALGEGTKILGEYAQDLRNGETDPAKYIGMFLRGIAPLYATWFGANGIWEPGHDIALPIMSWVIGTGATEVGKKRIKGKR